MQVYKRFFSLMTGRAISFGNFMALKAHAVKRLVVMQELSIHVAGAVLASKLRTGVCSLDRGPRYAGQSKMNFVGLALHGFKGLMVFAEDVLVRVGIACALIASLSVIGAGAAVVLKLLGFSTPGWFSVALGILVSDVPPDRSAGAHDVDAHRCRARRHGHYGHCLPRLRRARF